MTADPLARLIEQSESEISPQFHNEPCPTCGLFGGSMALAADVREKLDKIVRARHSRGG